MASKLFNRLPGIIKQRKDLQNLIRKPLLFGNQQRLHASTYPVDDIIFGLTEEQVQVNILSFGTNYYIGDTFLLIKYLGTFFNS